MKSVEPLHHLFVQNYKLKPENMIRLLFLILGIALSPSLFAQNKFAFNFYEVMEKDENIFFSPTSIKGAFAMAYEGAKGETQQEFESVFDFEEDNQAFLKELNQLGESAEISNSVWVMKNYKVLPGYIKKMEQLFNEPPYETDFAKDSEGSADKINKWIEESTNGMIKKMLTAEQVRAFKMALVNAVYFKQDWKNPFDEKRTFEKDFTNLDDSKTKVQMMRLKDDFRAFESRTEKIIELPYEDDKTSMVIVLPTKMKGYELNDESYQNLSKKMYWQKVNLELPKFTFETPTFELKVFLQKLGLKQAFQDDADFSGMREEKDLKIGTALHKAKIIVNEKGTEAAAATVIGMVATSASVQEPQPVMQFKTDKPFFYFIKDNQTGAILFVGKMNAMVE